jgi:hypothetical protein
MNNAVVPNRDSDTNPKPFALNSKVNLDSPAACCDSTVHREGSFSNCQFAGQPTEFSIVHLTSPASCSPPSLR